MFDSINRYLPDLIINREKNAIAAYSQAIPNHAFKLLDLSGSGIFTKGRYIFHQLNLLSKRNGAQFFFNALVVAKGVVQ